MPYTENFLKRAGRFAAAYGYSALSCAYLFLAGFLKVRNRSFIYSIARHFGGNFDRQADPALPALRLSEVLDDGVRLSVRAPVGRSGNISLLELLTINNLAACLGPENIFEIGTFDGRTALNLAANSPSSARVYTLDLPRAMMGRTRLRLGADDVEFIDKGESGALFAGADPGGKIVQLYGDSAAFDFGPYSGKMDFVFLDGSHSAEYVRSDSLNALKLLRAEGGVILWHDYGAWDGVTLALNELYRGGGVFAGLKHIEGTSMAVLDTAGKLARRAAHGGKA